MKVRRTSAVIAMVAVITVTMFGTLADAKRKPDRLRGDSSEWPAVCELVRSAITAGSDKEAQLVALTSLTVEFSENLPRRSFEKLRKARLGTPKMTKTLAALGKACDRAVGPA